MQRRRLLVTVAALAAVAAACTPYGPSPTEAGPPVHLTLVALRSQAGKSYFAASLRIAGDTPHPKARLTMRFPRGAVEDIEAPPEGTRVARVWSDSVVWELQDVGGPSIVGPFVLRARDSQVRPEWVKFSWTGGEVTSFDVVERFGGGAPGYGVLRPGPTTSKILVGHDSEITAYAVGGGIQGEIHVLALKDALDPAPPDAVVEEEVEVAAFAVHVEADKPYLVGLEMPAPRPLPPLARLRVAKASLDPPDAPLESATFAGMVSADGSRLLVPIAGGGRYKAYVDSDEYRAARSLLSPEVLVSIEEIRARLLGAMQAADPARGPAFLALGNPRALEILGKEAPRSGSYETATPLTDTAWTGPLLCSIQACIGSTFARPAVVCDTGYGNVGCLDTLPGVEEAGLTVGDAAKKRDICSGRVCFEPGKALVDNRGVEAARSSPVVFAVVGYELVSYSGEAVA